MVGFFKFGLRFGKVWVDSRRLDSASERGGEAFEVSLPVREGLVRFSNFDLRFGKAWVNSIRLASVSERGG